MSKASRKTRRFKRFVAESKPTISVAELLYSRLTSPDPRSHAEYLHDMRAKQAAGLLANPATAGLLDQLERAI